MLIVFLLGIFIICYFLLPVPQVTDYKESIHLHAPVWVTQNGEQSRLPVLENTC
jgi:preprotein translocase subunit YajC